MDRCRSGNAAIRGRGTPERISPLLVGSALAKSNPSLLVKSDPPVQQTRGLSCGETTQIGTESELLHCIPGVQSFGQQVLFPSANISLRHGTPTAWMKLHPHCQEYSFGARQIVFSVWVTLNEQKWLTFRECRGLVAAEFSASRCELQPDNRQPSGMRSALSGDKRRGRRYKWPRIGEPGPVKAAIENCLPHSLGIRTSAQDRKARAVNNQSQTHHRRRLAGDPGGGRHSTVAWLAGCCASILLGPIRALIRRTSATDRGTGGSFRRVFFGRLHRCSHSRSTRGLA
jgi:hypothetical protein